MIFDFAIRKYPRMYVLFTGQGSQYFLAQCATDINILLKHVTESGMITLIHKVEYVAWIVR